MCLSLRLLAVSVQYIYTVYGGGGGYGVRWVHILLFWATKMLLKDAWVSLLPLHFVQLNILTMCDYGFSIPYLLTIVALDFQEDQI